MLPHLTLCTVNVLLLRAHMFFLSWHMCLPSLGLHVSYLTLLPCIWRSLVKTELEWTPLKFSLCYHNLKHLFCFLKG